MIVTYISLRYADMHNVVSGSLIITDKKTFALTFEAFCAASACCKQGGNHALVVKRSAIVKWLVVTARFVTHDMFRWLIQVGFFAWFCITRFPPVTYPGQGKMIMHYLIFRLKPHIAHSHQHLFAVSEARGRFSRLRHIAGRTQDTFSPHDGRFLQAAVQR